MAAALLAARALAYVVALALTTAIAVAGPAVALFSVQGGSSALSLPRLAAHARLDDLQAGVGVFLDALQADGPIAVVAALAGAGAVALGVLLLVGVLARRRERLVVLRSDHQGTIAARPRAIGQAAVTLGEKFRDVLHAKARSRPRRRAGLGRRRLTIDALARMLTDAVVVIFALSLLWGGAMLVLLACKTSPATVESLSGYRSAYDHLASLAPADIGASTRLIAAIGGLAAGLAFGYVAWRAVARPLLARTDLRLADDERGSVDVSARAIERAAETAALAHPSVDAARARYATADLLLDISASRADGLAATLEDVHRRARDSLARHELPPLPVHVTLVHLQPRNRRELQ